MGFLRLKRVQQEVPIMIGCWNWLYNRLRATQKCGFELCGGAVSRPYMFSFAMLMPQGEAPLILNNSIHLAWPKCAVYKNNYSSRLFIYDFYQNAMTLSSPRMNGVATICFFSWLPPTKLIKFVTARQQMKRTVGATP